jgi:hypothetical protein
MWPILPLRTGQSFTGQQFLNDQNKNLFSRLIEHIMKSNKNLWVTLVLMIIVAALYRIIPDRPMGFAPQLAMALFGGAVIKDKKLAFAFPSFPCSFQM